MAARNPTWTYEELILAYKAFTKVRGKPAARYEAAAQGLSKQLRKLAQDAGVEISDTFRNFNGVSMKLRNLQGAESGGANGLKFTKRELEVVDRFRNDQAALALEASRAARGQKVWKAPDLDSVPSDYRVENLVQIGDDMVKASQDPLPPSSTLVHPQTHSLGKICKDEQNLRIPPHQRSYAWTADQVEEFVSDIQGLATAIAAGKQNPQHFFGGIVLVRTPDQSGWYIIDGQQRLTTFALSLAVLETAFEQVALVAAGEGDEVTRKSGELYGTMLRDEFLWTREVDPETGGRKERPRITPNERDVKAFEAILDGKSVPADRESQKLLVEARDQLASQLTGPLLSASRSAKEILRSLVTLQYALLKCCIVIQLSATDSGAAYRLFMVLNDRGLDLSEGDLLRAITLEALDSFPAQQRQAAEFWDQMLGESADDVKAFLRSYYPSVYGTRIDIWKVVDVYRDKVFEIGAVTGAKQAKRLVAQLEEMQEELLTFRMLRAGTWPLPLPSGSKAYEERVRRLVKTLKHDLATPLLLAGAKELTPLQFGKLVILLERFAFRYKNIGRGHAGKAGEAYYAHAMYIRGLAGGSRYSMSDFRNELAALIAAGDEDELFIDELRQRLQYSQSGQRGNIRWLLAAIEDFGPWLDDKSRAREPELSTTLVFDVESAHIDHVYPQNPKAGQGDPELDEVKHSLGNLVLLEQKPNRTATNAPFKDKRAFYAKTKLSETKTVGRKRSWKVASVEDREARLAKSAVILTTL
jgi:uncharacterized protein DUF262/uncharacterized protein DUF1524